MHSLLTKFIHKHKIFSKTEYSFQKQNFNQETNQSHKQILSNYIKNYSNSQQILHFHFKFDNSPENFFNSPKLFNLPNPSLYDTLTRCGALTTGERRPTRWARTTNERPNFINNERMLLIQRQDSKYQRQDSKYTRISS